MVGKVGFAPTQSNDARFTVWYGSLTPSLPHCLLIVYQIWVEMSSVFLIFFAISTGFSDSVIALPTTI